MGLGGRANQRLCVLGGSRCKATAVRASRANARLERVERVERTAFAGGAADQVEVLLRDPEVLLGVLWSGGWGVGGSQAQQPPQPPSTVHAGGGGSSWAE